MVQEYFEGYHLSDSDALFKENFSKKNIASDIIAIWNNFFEKNQLFLDSYSPFDLFIRKSRTTE
jgi:predicted unusual protein kinase regulating ubiquinone biosynthesis (AarF/ABC1/UbiB family)